MNSRAWKLLIGPVAFAVCWLSIPEEASFAARVAAGTFAWAVAWWIAQPVPWAVTALLPLIIFPIVGVMRTRDVAALYGQNVFFWILGTFMLGYAMDKHGLAKRFALRLLSARGVTRSVERLAFTYMAATALVSMFVSDAAAVALMIPIGMSIVAYLRQVAGISGPSRLAGFFALGALLAAQAGGMATMVGLPHNALAVAMLGELAGRTISWFQWMMVGLPLSILTLIGFYMLLRLFLPPEKLEIASSEEFLRSEASRLGRMSRAEKSVLAVFVGMVVLFMAPSLGRLALGAEHAASRALSSALPIWVVPPLVLLALFVMPGEEGETTLEWRDMTEHAPWNVMLLCTGALAMTASLEEFGLTDMVRASLQGLGLGSAALPYAAAVIVGAATNVISGLAATSLFCGIFIPMAEAAGFNPASMAMLVPNMSLGVMFPWAGAAAGTAFATGYLELRQMIKIGIVATAMLSILCATLHILFAPLL